MTKPPPTWAHKWCRNCVKHGSKSCNLWHLPGASACNEYKEGEKTTRPKKEQQ